MKKETTTYAVGYAFLFLILLFGSVLIWNSRFSIERKIAQNEEEARPAEIELTLITPVSCDQCIDGSLTIEDIEKQNVRILNSETISADSKEGQTLIETYGIEGVPTILVKGEFNKESVSELFSSFGGNEIENTLVIEANQPVYFDLASQKIIGLVDITYLSDSSCSDCYDPIQHRSILEGNFGLMVKSENFVDAESKEGQALIRKYSILETPTILLSSEALAYKGLAGTWQQVGSIDEDKTFVFRKNVALGPVVYKNLETGETIRPANTQE